MESMINALHTLINQLGLDKTYWIAYSGGLDSEVLLALCDELRQQLPVRVHAIHIHHGISLHADQWAKHCEAQCAKRNIPFKQQSVKLNFSQGDSLEEKAREARYKAFTDVLAKDDVLLTAHHENDQAETLLLQLFRGAGLKGLAAMPSIKSFANGWHARPLLGFNRETLHAYANAHHLTWINDESNFDTRLTRNFIRHEVMPLLKQRWPSIETTIARTADHCASAQQLLDEVTCQEWQAIKGSADNTLSVSKLLQLKPVLQKTVLRAWIHQLGFPLPDTKKLTTILQTVLTARIDRNPSVTWGDVIIRRYRDDLFLLKTLNAEVDSQLTFSWKLPEELPVPNVGTLRATLSSGNGLRADINQVSVRFRQVGEKVRIGQKRRTLKNLFQEWGVPVWQRPYIPLLFLGDELIAGVGYFLNAAYCAGEQDMGWQIALT